MTKLVSVNSDGVQASDYSHSIDAAISADGRSVMFNSNASNLTGNDTNATWDVFVHDLSTKKTARVSLATDGTEGNGASTGTAISADGSRVVFSSGASNLVPGDTNVRNDVFVNDRTSGTTSRASVGGDGMQANDTSEKGSISADGNVVTFQSLASNLVPDDTNGEWDIFVHDRTTGETTRVSVASNGTQSDNSSYNSAISADGRFVAFEGRGSNLVHRDENGVSDVFVHDRKTGKTTRVSVTSGGAQATDHSSRPAVSADGRYVAFGSDASDLVAGDTNGMSDAFVHDRATGETTRVSVATGGGEANEITLNPGISADGRYITFPTRATNLVPDDTNGTGDAFVHDRITGKTFRVSVASDGTQANGNTGMTQRAISANGRRIVFTSVASNLSADDHSPSNGILADIFVRILDDSE